MNVITFELLFYLHNLIDSIHLLYQYIITPVHVHHYSCTFNGLTFNLDDHDDDEEEGNRNII